MGFDIILPFLRPVQHLILDEDISEIMVNGSGASSNAVASFCHSQT